MNDIATKVLNVLDRAIAAPSRGWEFPNIRQAWREIDRLAAECAKIGKPQPVYEGPRMAEAHAEIRRLRQIVASAHAPAAAASNPEDLRVRYRAAGVVAGGLGSDLIMQQPARQSSRPGIEGAASLESRRARVFAAFNAYAGPSAAECLTQRPVRLVKIGKEDGLEHYDLERQDHNPEAAARVNRAYAKKLQAQRDANNSPEALREDIAKVLQAALVKGLTIPGESVKGLDVPQQALRLPEAQRVAAQQKINQFCAVLDGDEQAAVSGTPAAKAAIRFIEKQTGRPYTIGTTFASRS